MARFEIGLFQLASRLLAPLAVFHALNFELDICNTPSPLFAGLPAMMQNLPLARKRRGSGANRFGVRYQRALRHSPEDWRNLPGGSTFPFHLSPRFKTTPSSSFAAHVSALP